jgi:hypothetical protein
MEISKIDTAKEQLLLAIRLYFMKENPIGIHTIACASHQVLTDIADKLNINAGIHQLIDDYVKPEFRKELRNKILESRNFFKHSDRENMDDIVDFPENSNELIICDSHKKRLQV